MIIRRYVLEEVPKMKKLILVLITLISCGKNDPSKVCLNATQMVYKCVSKEIDKNPAAFMIDSQIQQCEFKYKFGSCYFAEELK